MKIINHTRWKTAQLRAIVKAVAEKEFDAHDRKRLIIEIKYGAKRSGGIGGKGAIGHSGLRPRYKSWIYLNQPEYYLRHCARCRGTKRWHSKTNAHVFEPMPQRLDTVELAYTIAHEFQHNKGRNHRQMHARYMGKEPQYFAWAKEFVVEPEESSEKPESNLE